MLAPAVQFMLVGLAIVAAMMLVVWVVHLVIRNAAIADAGWAFGLVLLAWWYASAAGGYHARRWVVSVMVGFWGLRLAIYLLFARVLGRPEEGRYVQLRREWRNKVPLRFLFFFEFQALVDVFLSLPFLLACMDPHAPLRGSEKLAAGLWLLAISGEALADRQLNGFKKNPENKGKTFRSGLWRYSRHPNYFFEWLIWLAYALFAIASPWGWLGLIAPTMILYFFLGASGIPVTERQALESRGDAYREYQRTTSAFVPWFPRK
jgi:steroid 5-alpha reductase family enzyme